MQAPLPPDEVERLRALSHYNILDTPPEQEFDDITLLAAHICKTPIASISLIDKNRQWFKSKVGVAASETSRDIAFCAHTILRKTLLVVEDAQADERFASNPLVTGEPRIRFYAGAPLVTADARALGTLCVIDRVPRTLTAEQKEALRALSRQVVAQLELRRCLTKLQETVTRLREAEESLRLLNSAVRQSKESILITEAELELPGPRIVFVNPAFTKMTGYTAEEVLGKTPRILQGPLTDKTVLRRLRENLESGGMFEGETINYRKDGTKFYLEWQVAPLRNDGGTITHFVAIQRNIDERKRLEARFRQLVNSNVQGVIFWNRKGEITEANDAFLRLIRQTREDLKAGRVNWRDLTPPEYAHLDQRCLDEVAIHGVSTPYEKEYVLTDGSRVPILLGAAAFADNLDEGVCFVLDLSERKNLEGRLFQAKKMETIGKLAGGVAHEFNSILTAIIGQSELLLGDLPQKSPLVKSASEIHTAANRAAILTRQLLAYGRKQIFQPESLDLNTVLAGLEGTLLQLVGTDIDVKLVPAAGLKTVKADAGQIEQVILNIVRNAVDAMPNGGKLTLETANVTLDDEYASHFPDVKSGDYVMLAITDTGAGMSPEVKTRVFDPFFSTKAQGQGTGLGLSTSYGIIKQSGGHINLYSELGLGTTFKIYLPHMEQRIKTPIRRSNPADLPRGMETILLVEDDPALREMAGGLLTRLGYTVWTAANGVEALSLKQDHETEHIDLLFTDVVMPEMNGKELSELVKAMSPKTKILFTSAYTENAIVHQGVLNQGVELLEKPFTPSALAHKLRDVLDLPLPL